MNASSEDIKDMLEAISALGLVAGTNLFIAQEPIKPNNCVPIFDTMGSTPDYTLDQKSIFNPSVQIRVRNISYETGWALIQAIADTLHVRAQETWNGTLYSVIAISSGPFMLQWDKNDRVILIVNFNIQRRDRKSVV